ncbi:MAG TPA: DNA polymerase domain-containing protein, partial [Candidatus Acidoferrales bacterium]|nr:DNA polymerase domain-containing protein [Candidatus Acidoferrales bacterium]
VSPQPPSTKGWILDVYPTETGKVAVWIIAENGERVRFTDRFQPCIYVSTAKPEDLELLLSSLCNNQKIASAQFALKYAQPIDSEKSRVLELTVKDCRQIPALTQEILQLGDYLRYEVHNCDVHNDRAYFFSRDLFPMAYVEVSADKSGLTYKLLDDVTRTDYFVPPMRVLRLDVDVAKKDFIPNFSDPINQIRLKPEGKEELFIDYGDEATKIIQLVYAVRELDPDIIVTSSGDSYLFPYLMQRAALNEVADEFILSRDSKPFSRKSVAGHTYFSYGHTFYRAGTIRLYGRIHIDENNTFIIKESGLDGFIEIARTCRVPLHTAARFSIGSSMSSIQFYQAQKDDILLPRNKKIPETFKSALDLLVGDRGGFIFEPRLGVHDGIGELDFSSMYPSLMRKYNISAETVLCKCCPDSTNRIPDLGYHICQKRTGMVPKTVNLALTKRLTYKRLRDQTTDKQQKQVYDKRQTALKWILVTCFGYLGFSNSKFGTVDGHIGVCAFARETFLKAAHLAEDEGFEVVHGIVDSLWLKKPDATMADYGHLCDMISTDIGIPINFEGYYKWIAFLPSRMHPRVSVLNRYLGVMDTGKIKVRGLEVRRRDTPGYIFDAQTEMIDALAKADNTPQLYQQIPEALKVLRTYRQHLLQGEIPLADLVVTKHMSRQPRQYRQQVSQVIAAQQLAGHGLDVHAGSSVKFLFTDSEHKHVMRRVKAAQLIEKGVNPDTKKYLLLLYSSAANLLSFAGYTPQTIYDAICGQQQKSLL